MAFYLYLIFGFAAGLLGGMGMGGGTILIPALTIFLSVEQHVAQATNLISFLPMAAVSLRTHAEKGLIKYNNLWWIIAPAVVLSVAGGVVAIVLPAEALRRLFGAFLLVLAVRQVVG
jgi:hypothetical protein